MDDIPHSKTSTQNLERVLSGIAAALCLFGCLWVGQTLSHTQPIWPLPALYLFEAALVSILGWLAVLKSGASSSPFSAPAIWAAAGILAAFVVIGLWSIGLLFVPVSALFFITAILVDHRQKNSIFLHLGIGALAAAAQIALMLFIVRFLI